MIYLIGVRKLFNKTNYTLIETETESFFTWDSKLVEKLLSKTTIKNVRLIDGEIKIKNWCNDLSCVKLSIVLGSEYTLLCKIDEDKFKITSSAEMVEYINAAQLKRYIQESKIANCSVINGEYKSIDTYNVTKNIQFEQYISNQYERYIAMTRLTGQNTTFNYVIEGREVKLRKYTGTSKKVIVPKFITSIMSRAFMGSDITEVKLEQGLKTIGSLAFNNCELYKITIPETVEFIGLGALYGNRELVADRGDYKDTITILNKNTTIIDEYVLGS